MIAIHIVDWHVPALFEAFFQRANARILSSEDFFGTYW
jgi:hypothetical protein